MLFQLAQNSRKQKPFNDFFQKSKNCFRFFLWHKLELKNEVLFVIVLTVSISTYNMPIPRYIDILALKQNLPDPKVISREHCKLYRLTRRRDK